METPDPVVFPVADGITAIDTFMGGRARYTAAYLLDAMQPTLVETGPGTSVAAVTASLEGLGIGPQDLAHVVLTHIHLDHAGGVGMLSDRLPRAMIWVHEMASPLLVDVDGRIRERPGDVPHAAGVVEVDVGDGYPREIAGRHAELLEGLQQRWNGALAAGLDEHRGRSCDEVAGGDPLPPSEQGVYLDYAVADA